MERVFSCPYFTWSILCGTPHYLSMYHHYIKFRTRVANDPSLRWDIRDLDLWLECLPGTSNQPNCCPCHHCGSTTHYPSHCSFHSSSPLTGGKQPVPANSQQRATSLRPPHAAISTELAVTKKIVNFHTDVTFVPGHTQPRTASQRGSFSLIKPPPWTPLRPFILECKLCSYPNRVFARQLIDDLQQGCDIGYTGPQFPYFAPNLQSASQQPEVIDATLRDECEAGWILGPFDQPPLANFRTSGFCLVPKHDGGWRIIYHLSVPLPHSINDFIDPQAYSLSSYTIDHAYKILNELL